MAPGRDSPGNATAAIHKVPGSIEITGRDAIASLIVSFWYLVEDGRLWRADYLVFVGLLLVVASRLV
jgi:hypothetical protein